MLASSAAQAAAGTWRGRIETLVVDNFEAGTSRSRVFLHTSRESLELEPGAFSLQPGQVVDVTGQASGKRLMASQVNAVPADSATATCSAIGEQKIAVILASFPSKALLSSVTPALMKASFFGPGLTLDTFLRESSFGQTWASGDVLGPYVLDADYFDEPLAARDAALRAAAPFTDLTQYSRFFVVVPQGETGMDSGGMALIGCGTIDSPQGTLTASSMWLGAESMVAQTEVVETAAHEIGHGFGLEHARLADYGSDALGPAGETAAPWDQLHDYGDSFSNMGRNSGQWAAPQKARLGWLADGTNIQTVTASGNFTLLPYEAAGTGQVIKVSRGTGADDWLWIEYRQPSGTFDGTLPPSAFAGALVHYADPALTATLSGVDAASYTNLVNFHPSAAFGTDPILHAGETWKDPYGSLSLTVNSATSAGLSLSVSYAPVPACPSSAGSAQSFDATGGAGQIAITAPGSCSWNAAASVPWIILGATRSGTGNGSVSFTVAQNSDVSPRWGKIQVGDAFAIVTQAGGSAWMAISPQNHSIPAAGGTGEFSVATSAPDLAWTMGVNVPWITDTECSCYLLAGPATVRYTVAVNSGPERTGIISVGGLPFTVTQQAGPAESPNLTFDLLAPNDAPTARLLTAMAPFGHSGKAILYGGVWNTTAFADTWLWDGANWTLLQPANNPGLLSGHAMVYDEARRNIVLFGGTDGAGMYSNQTWIFDGNNWRQAQPAASPSPRSQHAMAYDPVLQKVVLFGGSGEGPVGAGGGVGELNDTWTWDGVNWTQVTNAQSPLPRLGHAMAFDAERGQIVLFGGMFYSLPGEPVDPAPTWFSDTWLLDASGWHQALTATPPAARFGHVLAYHPLLGAVVMIGGYGGKDVGADGSWDYDFRKETWVWNRNEWVQQFPDVQPGPAYTTMAVYDDTRQALTVHLGDDLTCISRGPKTFFLRGRSTTHSPLHHSSPRR